MTHSLLDDAAVLKASGPLRRRLELRIRGTVQGAGFRPFAAQLARELGLGGWVRNSAEGVTLQAEGSAAQLRLFLRRLNDEKPVAVTFHGMESLACDPAGDSEFVILESNACGPVTAAMLPDIAVCAACLREMSDPSDRRYRYPFINCSHCGPRFTIIESLPYDRAHTSMKKFTMCRACRSEYEDPRDRRYHAQPAACPSCGPGLELWGPGGVLLSRGDQALRLVTNFLDAGKIAAVKGLGGFHLMADAFSEPAAARLRELKQRGLKPFAVMAASASEADSLARLSKDERRWLLSPEAPIVIARRRFQACRLAPSVAPETPWLGLMLPSSPLHHLLLGDFGRALIATSGNAAEEVLCTDEREAVNRLSGFADVFLVHNRPIVRHADDSLVRRMGGRLQVLRRARGFAPLAVLETPGTQPLLAGGGHLKNTVAFAAGGRGYLSQHLGDLDDASTAAAWRKTVRDFENLYGARPLRAACDLHPGYASTRLTQGAAGDVLGVQHHYAHALACMADNGLEGPALAAAWDGTGWGPDGTVWGGEFLRLRPAGFARAAHFRTFPLPGGEAAVQEPRRALLGLFYEMAGEKVFEAGPYLRRLLASGWSVPELSVMRQMLASGLNSPRTSSAGRFFDAISALLGFQTGRGFEGEAAMKLESRASGLVRGGAPEFDFHLTCEGTWILDWEPAVRVWLHDMEEPADPALLAGQLHRTLAGALVRAALRIGEERVLLTGGCFQNRLLTALAVTGLRRVGLRPYWHQRIPPNDGGLAAGQLAALVREVRVCV